MTPQSARKRWSRRVRRAFAESIAACIAAFPSLEPLAVRLGRAAAKRTRLLGLYWFVQEGLLARLRRQGERFRTVPVLGRHLQLDITDPTGRMPYFYSTPYEEGVTDAIVTALKPGDVFVDVGANIGYFTVLAAHVVGAGGRVVAFEPHEVARAVLETMVQRNEASACVEIVPLALADTAGDATLFVDDAVTAYSTIEPSLSPMRHVAALHPAADVPVTTLDTWMGSHPELLRRVRCVKIDVGGAEARVLAGMTAMLQLGRLTIICETRIGSAADTTLTRAGFERQRIESGFGYYGNFLYVRH
jgi:FkbM family methyltransferase